MDMNNQKPQGGGWKENGEFINFMLDFQHEIMHYESAAKCVTMRLEIADTEFRTKGWRPLIHTISSRIKEPMSIYSKLVRKGCPVTVTSIRDNLDDVAGVRVICNYIEDVYAVRKLLLEDEYLELVREKDYIKTPKPNGYRSLHLIVNVPVLLKDGKQKTRCEIQLRTSAMDSWASLEHNLRYKKDLKDSYKVDEGLKCCAEMLYQSDLKMQKIAEQMDILTAV